MLAAENLGGVLLNAQHNFAWMTGGKSNGVNLSVESGACFLMVRGDGKKFVLANNIEMRRLLTEEISADDFEPIETAWQDEKSSGNFIIEKAKSLLNENKNLASDLPISSDVRPLENLIARCRYELTEAEIARYRTLGKDAGTVLGNVFETLRQGETEIEIARKVKSALAIDKIESVVTLVGADERIKQFRHPVPTANTWEKVLLIVVCGKREGMIVSLSRIACIDAISDELQRRTEATAQIFARILSKTKVGKSGAELYDTAKSAYAENGFADEINLHHQGGATGYKTRDWLAHPKCAEVVRKNQAFAWNPSVTGAKIEETVIVGANKVENLTASPNFPQIKVEIDGKEFFVPGILQL